MTGVAAKKEGLSRFHQRGKEDASLSEGVLSLGKTFKQQREQSEYTSEYILGEFCP